MAAFPDISPVEPLATQLRQLDGLADSFGRSMTTAFRRSVVDGKALEEVLRSLALSLSSRALNQALGAIGQGIFSGLIGGLSTGARLGNAALAQGSSLASTRPARGSPIIPAREPRGGINVTLHVTTPDAASFRRAEADIGAMLARAVARGQRGM